MKLGSLFAGIGGFDLAAERAGMKVAWQCEIDQKAQGVLRRHFPEAIIYDDVRKIGKHNLEPVDVLVGGFPCQDVSIAGKREGLAGERSGLWHEFARIIDELDPGWVVIENVPGLLSSNKGADFATIVRWLAERGYGVCWRVLDAQYFGVAQRRRRVFIVASFGGGRCAQVLFEREGVRWDPPTRREAGERTANTFTTRSGKEGGGKGYLGLEDGAMTLGGQPQYLTMSTGQANAEIVNDGSPSLTANHEQPLVWDLAQITSKSNNSQPKTEYNHTLNSVGQMMNGVRRLTPTECERLQGFPDGWTDGQSDTQRYKQLGNAVAVPVVGWILRRING